MWNIFGLLFYGDSQRLVDDEHKTFRLDDIKALLTEHGIAIYDTATAVRRMSGNASDKDLQVVEPANLPRLLHRIPLCHDMACTGQKSFSVLGENYGATTPAMGEYVQCTIDGRDMRLWRMPSSSRAYPMPLPDKAAYYHRMMQQLGLL